MMSSNRAPVPSDDSTVKRMRSQRKKDTGYELAVRRILFSCGLRYRIDCHLESSIRRKAGLVFRKTKAAVFIDEVIEAHGGWPGAFVTAEEPSESAEHSTDDYELTGEALEPDLFDKVADSDEK